MPEPNKIVAFIIIIIIIIIIIVSIYKFFMCMKHVGEIEEKTPGGMFLEYTPASPAKIMLDPKNLLSFVLINPPSDSFPYSMTFKNKISDLRNVISTFGATMTRDGMANNNNFLALRSWTGILIGYEHPEDKITYALRKYKQGLGYSGLNCKEIKVPFGFSASGKIFASNRWINFPTGHTTKFHSKEYELFRFNLLPGFAIGHPDFLYDQEAPNGDRYTHINDYVTIEKNDEFIISIIQSCPPPGESLPEDKKLIMNFGKIKNIIDSRMITYSCPDGTKTILRHQPCFTCPVRSNIRSISLPKGIRATLFRNENGLDDDPMVICGPVNEYNVEPIYKFQNFNVEDKFMIQFDTMEGYKFKEQPKIKYVIPSKLKFGEKFKLCWPVFKRTISFGLWK